VKRISRSQRNDGFGADSGPSRGDPRIGAIRPTETYAAAICYVRFTSFPVRRATAILASPARNRAPGHGHPRSGSASLLTLIAPCGHYRPRPSAKPDRSPASARHAPSGHSASAKRQARREPRQPRVGCSVQRQASERPRHAHHSPSPSARHSPSGPFPTAIERPGLSFADGVWRWRPRWRVGGPPALAQAEVGYGSLAGPALYYPRKLL
jgi:hypothetical protein